MHSTLPLILSRSAWRRARAAAVVLLVGLSGCSQIPRLRPLPPEGAARVRSACAAVFPAGSWRAVHAIRARLPLGRRTALVGVSAWNSRARSLRVVAVALEGVTLLDLEVTGHRIAVRRAVPPFDRAAVSEGMARDVALLLRPPAVLPAALGLRPGGRLTCRYRTHDGGVVDVVLQGLLRAEASGPRLLLPAADGARAPRPGEGGGRAGGPDAFSWSLFRYGSGGRLERVVRASGRGPRGFARRMHLSAPGAVGYHLDLRLLRVQ